MHWYNYLACFFSGVFLANAVPHFIHGISGDKFPTPFAKPPGKGLSSPSTNVIWSVFNLVAGYLLLQAGEPFGQAGTVGVTLFFAGVLGISIALSVNFQKKFKE